MYKIQYTRPVEKQLRKLSPDIRKHIFTRIEKLASNPRPIGVTKLTGENGFYRVRQGSYRIVYEIEDNKLIILVVKVGHRSDIYRN